MSLHINLQICCSTRFFCSLYREINIILRPLEYDYPPSKDEVFLLPLPHGLLAQKYDGITAKKCISGPNMILIDHFLQLGNKETPYYGTDIHALIDDIVVEANRRGIEAAKPGNRMCDVDLAARNYIEEKGFGEYFTHRTGHSIGLEDHEFGDVSSVNTDIIKVGQCFSVEPGIYLPDENIGVRIEDLVIITEDGCEVLNDFTKDLIVVPEE